MYEESLELLVSWDSLVSGGERCVVCCFFLESSVTWWLKGS